MPTLLVALASCVSGSVPSARPPVAAAPEPIVFRGDPQIRVGLAVGATRVSIGASDAVLVNEPDGARVTTIPPGEVWQVSPVGQRLALVSPGGWVSPSLDAVALAAADSDAPLHINGKPYRGVAELLRDRTGITVVNRLGVEAYLQGVVSAEMGRRSSSE